MNDQEDDQEVCRVCRCEATEEEPLFYPCKCSGSIRYVHQNCLHEWLAHSKREHCELCGHSYAFTPVYQPDMPATIPFKILLRQVLKKAFIHLCFSARFLFVSIIWFIVLPYCTVWATRFCLWTGPKYSAVLEQLIGEGVSPETQQTVNTIAQSIASATSSTLQTLQTQTPDLPSNTTAPINDISTNLPTYPWLKIIFFVVSWFDNRPYVRKFFMDCSEGQSLVFYLSTVTFIGFMARNWVLENMPVDIDQIPENLEDEELEQNEDAQVRNWILRMGAQVEIPEVRQPELLQQDQEPIIAVAQNLQHQFPLQDQVRNIDNIPQDINQADPVIQQRPIEEPERLENVRNRNEGVFNEENAIGELFGILDINGPLANFLKNVTILLVSILVILVVSVWVPYLVGITFILSNPIDMVHHAFKEMRFLYDIIRHGVYVGWNTYFDPAVKHLYQPYFEAQSGNSPSLSVGPLIEETLGEFWRHLPIFNQIPTSTIISNIPTPVAKLLQENASLTDTLHHMSHQFSRLQIHFHNAAFGSSQYDQLLCIAIGHFVFLLGALIYLSQKSNVIGRIGHGIKIFLRQQVVVFKLIIFLFLEMVAFPCVCGIALNMSMAPYISSPPLGLRWMLIKSHPVQYFEIHWFAGFSIILGLTRIVLWFQKVIRPGAAWFIESFANRELNLFREIPERSIIAQLCKSIAELFFSSILIFSSIGGTLWCIRNTTNILPLRWRLNDNLPNSESCLILLMYTTIPHILTYYQTKKTLQTGCKKALELVCNRLRLTSYMLGNRIPEEEGTPFYTSWLGWVSGNIEMLDKDGQLALVPKRNTVKWVQGRRMLVPVDPDTLQPLDPEERRLGHPAESGPGGREVNTTIVYLPPDFKTRIAMFLFALWISIVVAAFSFTLGPIALGYFVLIKCLRLSHDDRNDVYSYCTGAVVILVLGVLVRKAICIIHSLRNRENQSSILELINLAIYDTARWVVKVSFLGLNCCVIFPILIGIILELYTHIYWTPIGSMEYRVPLLTLMERGLGLLVVVKHIHTKAPYEPWQRNWSAMLPTDDVRDLDISYALKRVFGPLILICVALIAVPFFADDLASRLFGYTRQDSTTQWSYSISLICIIMFFILRKMAQGVMVWIRSTREDVFMLRRDLNNFDGNQQGIGH
ncbi:hypothetical protein F4703DRAFT_1866371 [Phycomyces blakesleeanus]